MYFACIRIMCKRKRNKLTKEDRFISDLMKTAKICFLYLRIISKNYFKES